jgi:hypothetical protein
MPGCSPLFGRITLIILGAVAIWITIYAVVQMIAINQVVPSARPGLLNTAYLLTVIQLVVGILTILYVLYAILLPGGTFREYVKPKVYETEVVVPAAVPAVAVKRRAAAAVSDDD